MRDTAKRKRQGSDKAKQEKRPQPVKDRKNDSDDIERAVYDGMQDLRVSKPDQSGRG